MPVLLAIGMLLLAIGATLFIIGVRGKPIDNHPICRKCGFDLFGLGEAVKCPECGTELSSQTIRLGHRAIRRVPAGMGAVLMVPSIVVVAAIALAMLNHLDFQRHKPIGWLLRDGDVPAIREFDRRLAAGMLSDETIARIVDVGLAIQRDSSKPWLGEWGMFIEHGRYAGKVSDARWQRYARQAVPLSMTARSNVRRGDRLPIKLQLGPSRVGSSYLFAIAISINEASLNGVPIHVNDWMELPVTSMDRPIRLGSHLALTIDALAKLRDGPNTLNLKAAVTIKEHRGGGTNTPLREIDSRTETLSDKIDLRPATEQTVAVLIDPSLRPTMERTLSVNTYLPGRTEMDLRRSARNVRVRNGNLEFVINCDAAPIGIAVDAFARTPDGIEWPVAKGVTFSLAASDNWIVRSQPDGFNADRVDVILRPNPAAAADTVDITQIWGGEIRFRDVPVVWDKNATRPTSTPADPRYRAATTRSAAG